MMTPLNGFWCFLAAIAYTAIGCYVLKNNDKISKASIKSDIAFWEVFNSRTNRDEKKGLIGVKILMFVFGGSFLAAGILAFILFIGFLLSVFMGNS